MEQIDATANNNADTTADPSTGGTVQKVPLAAMVMKITQQAIAKEYEKMVEELRTGIEDQLLAKFQLLLHPDASENPDSQGQREGIGAEHLGGENSSLPENITEPPAKKSRTETTTTEQNQDGDGDSEVEFAVDDKLSLMGDDANDELLQLS